MRYLSDSGINELFIDVLDTRGPSDSATRWNSNLTTDHYISYISIFYEKNANVSITSARQTSSNYGTLSSFNPVIEGGRFPSNSIALHNIGPSSVQNFNTEYDFNIGNLGSETASIILTFLPTTGTTGNIVEPTVVTGSTASLEFLFSTTTATGIQWNRNFIGNISDIDYLDFTLDNTTTTGIPWDKNDIGNVSATGTRIFDISPRPLLFLDSRSQTFMPGEQVFAGQPANIEESNTVFINASNQYTGVYPLPKSTQVTFMSTSTTNTGGPITKELQFNVGSSLYNDATSTNAPSYINLYVVSSYVSPSSSLTDLQLIQRSRQVWLTG